MVVQKIVGEQERGASILRVCVMRVLSDVSVLFFHPYFSEPSEWRRKYQTVSRVSHSGHFPQRMLLDNEHHLKLYRPANSLKSPWVLPALSNLPFPIRRYHTQELPSIRPGFLLHCHLSSPTALQTSKKPFAYEASNPFLIYTFPNPTSGPTIELLLVTGFRP